MHQFLPDITVPLSCSQQPDIFYYLVSHSTGLFHFPFLSVFPLFYIMQKLKSFWLLHIHWISKGRNKMIFFQSTTNVTVKYPSSCKYIYSGTVISVFKLLGFPLLRRWRTCIDFCVIERQQALKNSILETRTFCMLSIDLSAFWEFALVTEPKLIFAIEKILNEAEICASFKFQLQLQHKENCSLFVRYKLRLTMLHFTTVQRNIF